MPAEKFKNPLSTVLHYEAESKHENHLQGNVNEPKHLLF
jgi:hypothetical protein